MRPYCLASSSAGNCYVFEFEINGIPTRIMVECGIPISILLSRLNFNGIDISTIQACLITHAHGDHCYAATNIESYGIPVFATESTLKAIHVEGQKLLPLQVNKICDGIFVMPFSVEHDCEGSVGFVIKTKDECVIFVNDHKLWKDNLVNFKPDYVFIECNYDHKVVYAQYNELKKRLEKDSLSKQEYLQTTQLLRQHERNLNSHCSLRGTIKGLEKLDLSHCKAIFLMHLSDRYANEYKMKNEVQYQTKILTYACKKEGGIK